MRTQVCCAFNEASFGVFLPVLIGELGTDLAPSVPRLQEPGKCALRRQFHVPDGEQPATQRVPLKA